MVDTQAVQNRISDFLRWRRQLTDELERLPETLMQLREGVANFQLVTRRLADGTEALEQMNELYRSGVGDAARRYAEAANAVRTQLEQIQPGKLPTDLMENTVSELKETLGALADLNPLWRAATRDRRPDKD